MKSTSPTTGAPAPIVVTSPAELAAIVRDAVEQVLAEQQQDPAPYLLDRNGIAKRLGVGLNSVDRFRRAGMPFVLVGEAPRFVADECLAWLRTNSRAADDGRGE